MMRLFGLYVRLHNVDIEAYHLERTKNWFYKNNQRTFICFKLVLYILALSYIMFHKSFLHIKHT